MNEQTPRAERLHIAFYGRRNSGKSSLINALTGQQSAVVSATPGTTTDPVLKTMEIHGLGPCVLIDTPGFDDEGDLGALRVQQSRKMLDKTDLAVLLLSGAVPQNDEIEWFRLLEARHIPIVVVRSKADLFTGMSDAEAEALFGQRPLRVSASDRTGLDALREALIRNLPEDYNQPEITGSLASTGDVVMLVMPQDIQAPKGRLILPQVQTIRELLDKKCRVVCCTTDQIEGTLSSLAAPPKLIITDSQVFSTVYAQKPAASLLTSFSVLFARYKGDIDYFVESAAAIGQLREDSRDAPQTDRTRTAGRCGCRHGLSRRPHALRPGNPLRRLYVQPAPRIEPRRPGPRPARPDDQLRRGDRLPARDSRQDRILTPKTHIQKSGPSDNWTAHSLSKTETIPANTISPPTGNTSYTVRAGTWPKCRS